MIEKEYAGFNHSVKTDIDGQIWDIVLEIDLEPHKEAYRKKVSDEEKPKVEEAKKKLAEFAKATALKFGKFRALFYSSIIEKMMSDLTEKKKPEPMVININAKNKLTMFPDNNKITLIYGIDFEQKTDISLIKNLLSEFQEAHRHVRNSLPVSYYAAEKDTPDNIKKFDKPENYTNGLIVFTLPLDKYKVYQKKICKFYIF